MNISFKSTNSLLEKCILIQTCMSSGLSYCITLYTLDLYPKQCDTLKKERNMRID